jgi:hypothetical protein
MAGHEPPDLPSIESPSPGDDDEAMFGKRKRRKVVDPASYTSEEFPPGVLERIIEWQRNDPKFQAKLKVIEDYQRAYERDVP